MSQAAYKLPPRLPFKPARRKRPVRLLLVPGVVLALLAIPGGLFAYANGQFQNGQGLESQAKYTQAIAAYQSALGTAGNPVCRPLLGEIADSATTAIARSRVEWGRLEEANDQFAPAEQQFKLAVASGLRDYQTAGNQELATLYVAWGDYLAGQQKYQDAIDHYRKVSDYDPAGSLKSKVDASLASAYAAYALSFTKAQPADYPNALTWYQNLLRDYPDSPEAVAAKVDAIPSTLYNAGLAFVQLTRYDDARTAMQQVITQYPKTTWATKAQAALAAKQVLSGKLVQNTANGPVPVVNRLVRISTKWRIVAAHTYSDSGGSIYQTTTDAQGNFSIAMPPGQNYLITWWDPSRSTFVTTFLSADVPVNVVTINPLEPATKTVNIN